MKAKVLLCGLASLWLAGCGSKSSTSSQTTNAANNGSSPLTAPVDYLGAIGAAKIHAEATIDLAQVRQAIQLFVADEGRYPKDLDELVQKNWLPKGIKAPYGKQIVYDPNTGQVSITNK